MSKKDDEKTITEKLVWRLSSKPTVSDVHSLLENEVITKEEARSILFSVDKEEEADPLSLADLKKEIEFMRGLVLQAMNNANQTQIVKYIERWPSYRFEWVKPYYTLANSLPVNASFSMLSSGGAVGVAPGGASGTTILNDNSGSKINAVMPHGNAKFDGSSDPNNRFVS